MNDYVVDDTSFTFFLTDILTKDGLLRQVRWICQLSKKMPNGEMITLDSMAAGENSLDEPYPTYADMKSEDIVSLIYEKSGGDTFLRTLAEIHAKDFEDKVLKQSFVAEDVAVLDNKRVWITDPTYPKEG